MNLTQKNEDKDWKEVYKLMNNAIDQKTKENLRNRINVKFVNNEKKPLKMHTKTTLYVAQNISQ